MILLHGGPGISELAAYSGLARRLRHPDRDVYIYDQIGAGASSRLSDPRGYGIRRDVSDLEEIRQILHVPHLTLAGHSYGAYLAVSYAAAHPDRVDGMALISPQPLGHRDASASRVVNRLPPQQRISVLLRAVQPRPLLTYLLARSSPTIGHRIIGDRPADARNDQLLQETRPALHCRGVGDEASSGSGFYAMQAGQGPISAGREAWLSGRLTHLHTRVLIIKGSCDYLSWHSALDYQRVLEGAELAYIHGAGHNVVGERTNELATDLQSFLDGHTRKSWSRGALPAPSDYLGPP